MEYNRGTSGLASLLQGFAQGRKDNRASQMEERKLAMVDPSRPIGLRDFLEPAVKEYVNQSTMAQYTGRQVQPFGDFMQSFMKGIPQLQNTLQPQAQAPMTPTMPAMPTPTAQTPATPAPVSRSGYSAQDIVDAMRKKGLVK